MKRILKAFSLLIIFSLIITGCTSGNILNQYKQALEKTENIERASELMEFTMDMDFNSLNLTIEEKKQLDMFRSIKGSFVTRRDKVKGISYMDGHVDMTNLGFDVKIYEDQEKIVALLPIFSKYMVIPKDSEGSLTEKSIPMTQVNQEEIKNLWDRTITKSNIQKLGNKMLSTNEGEVRTTAFEVTLQDAEIKELAKTFVQVVLKDPEIKQSFMKFMKEMQKVNEMEKVTDSEKTFSEFLNNIEKGIDQMKINKFRHTGSFDKDHYIVEEKVNLNYDIEVEPSKNINVNYAITVTRWDINKGFDFEMPSLNKDNSFTVDKFNENTPKLFEDLFKSPIK